MLGAIPSAADAHPLGNFTTNQYSRIEVREDGLRLVYVLDLAEIPAFQEIQTIDANGDDAVGDAEREAYLDAKLAELGGHLRLAADGVDLPLRSVARELSFPDGQAGLKLLRLRAVFSASLPDSVPVRFAFRNTYATDRLGWREIVVTHGPGVRLDDADAPATDRSDELRTYPDDLLASPLDRTAAAFGVALVPGAPAAVGFADLGMGAEPVADGGNPGGDLAGRRLAALVTADDLSPVGVLVAFGGAFVWGALHALSPGHGKTVVGAYLVGARGTPRHALFLGLTVTVTHTAGVLVLGLVTVFASRYVVPERLYPWMTLISGLLVATMGATILRHRLRGHSAPGHAHGPAEQHAPALQQEHSHSHDHDHDHLHAHGIVHDYPHADPHAHHPHDDDHAHIHAHGPVHSHGGHTHSHLPPERVTWRGLLALGVSGGLLPCPSALLVLLGAIALGRAGFGVLLVLVFSLGLAGTLTAVGLLFLSAGRFLERRAPAAPWTAALLRYAPIGGAAAVTLAGVAIVVRALRDANLL